MPAQAPPYMCEIGTMWQIGVLTGKSCTFLVQNGSFSRFLYYKNKERISRGLDVKWHIPSICLDAFTEWVSIAQETPQNGQNVHGFQVRTPICHIVHVSSAYPPTRPLNPPRPPPLGGRFGIEMASKQEIDVKSMSSR